MSGEPAPRIAVYQAAHRWGERVLLVVCTWMLLTQPRRIWIDEFLQFAFGAYPDSWEALQAISASIAGVNHGQTGAMMFLHHLLLKWFGASYLLLRLPSVLAYACSLAAGAALLRDLGVSPLVRLLLVFCLGYSHLNLVLGAEARPYVLLEASVLGFLWASRRFFSGKSGPGPALGVAVAGILFHPFFAAYLGLFLLALPLFSRESRETARRQLRSRKFLVFLVFGAALLGLEFFLVGKFSWFQTLGRQMGLNPYEYIGTSKSLPRFMIGTFFYPFGIPATVLLSALLAFAFLRRHSERELWAHFLALLAVLVLTQFILVQSVLRSSYWILQRQWIAGSALALVSAALLLEFAQRALLSEQARRRIFLGCLPLLLVLPVLDIGKHLRAENPPSVPIGQSESWREKISRQKEITPSEYEALAHQNLILGGPVWPVFRRYYSP